MVTPTTASAPVHQEPASGSPWFAAARRAAHAEGTIAIRPLIERDRLVGVLAVETAAAAAGHPRIEGWWFSPVESGRWAGVRAGGWPGARPVAVTWRTGGWPDFLSRIGGRALVGDDLAHALRPIRASLGQAGAGPRGAADRPLARFLDRPLVDLHEAADGLARAGRMRAGGSLGLAELAASVGVTVSTDPSPFARLLASAIVWERLLRPALRALVIVDHAVPTTPTPALPWPSAVVRNADPGAPIRALLLWFPRGGNTPVIASDIADLRVRPDPEHRTVAISGGGRDGELRMTLSTRSTSHLVDLLRFAWPIGGPVRSTMPIRVIAALRIAGEELTLSSRSISLTFEPGGEEARLPAGVVLRIETIGLPPDPDEGLELLIPVADGAPIRLRAALSSALATLR